MRSHTAAHATGYKSTECLLIYVDLIRAGGRTIKVGTALLQQALSVVFAALVLQFSAGTAFAAQEQSAPSPLQPLSPDQLDNLVAPIALYPDVLLSQVLVASTYPLELVEAGQWLERNQNLQGPQLVEAARQQNWDPSIQALVVFPDVIGRLNSNIRWTTDLGNAFLAQQADVMNAVQRMRAEARAAGKLNATTEETIATDTQGGQTAIEIQPTDPEVMYVPSYNPEDVWGPPDYGDYPPLDYPDVGYGFDFGPGIYLGGFFGGLGWGGWGWGPNWFNCSIFENGYFFNHYGFRGFDGRGFGGRGTWAHNPEHRLGVAYPNQRLANRFGGNFWESQELQRSVAQRERRIRGQPAPNAASFIQRQSQPVESVRKFGFSAELPNQPGIWREPGRGDWLSLRSLLWRIRGYPQHARLSLPSIIRWWRFRSASSEAATAEAVGSIALAAGAVSTEAVEAAPTVVATVSRSCRQKIPKRIGLIYQPQSMGL